MGSGQRLLLAAVAVMVVVIAGLAATFASFVSVVSSDAVARELAPGPGTAVKVSAGVSPGGLSKVDSAVTGALRRALTGVPVTFERSAESDALDMHSPAASAHRSQIQLITLDGLPRHAVLEAGAWPAPARGGTVQAALPAAAARALRTPPGTVLSLSDSATGAVVRVRVTGAFRPQHAGSPYWQLDPLGGAGVRQVGEFSEYGPLVTSPAALAGGHVPATSAAWEAVPHFGPGSAVHLSKLGGRLNRAVASLASGQQAEVTSSLPDALSRTATALTVARSQLVTGLCQLLVVAAAALAAMVRLLAGPREAVTAVMRARGASRRQVMAAGLVEGALLAAPAAVAGPLLAGLLTPLLLRTGSLSGAGLRPPAGIPAVAWWAGIAAAAGGALLATAPWLRAAASPVHVYVRQGRPHKLGAATRAGVDLALVVIAVLAGWQLAHSLAHNAAPVSTGLATRLGFDPVLAAAPALVLLAASAVTQRLLPAASWAGDWLAARWRGVTAALAAWQISRRPLRQAGPALLAVLAVATAVLALAQQDSWRRSAWDQAAFTVGGDERLDLPPTAPLPPGQVAEVTAAPGTGSATPVAREPVDLPQQGTATLLALDARAAGAVAALHGTLTAPGFSPLRRLVPAGPLPGAVVPGRPARIQLTARLGPLHGTSAVTALTQSQLTVELSDAAGIGYDEPTGALPADGRPHVLTIDLGGQRADYPLRLTGLMVTFGAMPHANETDMLALQAAQALPPGAGAGTAASGISFTGRLASQNWLPRAAGDSTGGNAPGLPAATVSPAPGGGVDVTFRPGVIAPAGTGTGTQARMPATVAISAGQPEAVIPALATSAFLTAIGQRTGSTVPVEAGGVPVRVLLAGTVSWFPTLTGSGGGLVVDQEALQDAVRAAGGTPVPVTEWWLRTSSAHGAAALPDGSSMVSTAGVAMSLVHDPLSAGPEQEALAIAACAAFLALTGFAVSAATGPGRASEEALLQALGFSRAQFARTRGLEQALVAVPAAATGMVLGTVLARLVLPALILTLGAAHPVPPVAIQIPWPAAGGVAAAVAGVPVLAAAVGSRRAGNPAAMLRENGPA